MNSPEFKSFSDDFNRSSTSFLEQVASSLRERLIQNANNLVTAAFEEDEKVYFRLRNILTDMQDSTSLESDDLAFIRGVRSNGVPLFLKRHDPSFEEVQVGTEFVNAVSCRLVERKFVPTDEQLVTPMHLWPSGKEMVVYLPVVAPFSDDLDEERERPVALSEDIFIKYTAPNEVTGERESVLYAIGTNYCYRHEAVGSADFEIDLMMQDLGEFAKNLKLSDLNLEQLAKFHLEMINMQRWPINVYWPGVTASDIQVP